MGMMIRRKKKKETPEKFRHEPKDRRKSFRVQPSNKEEVSIEMAEKTIQVFDISAGGIAFTNQNLKEGQDQSIKINLPDGITIESVKIKIISIDETDICHARFLDIEPSETENIHQYTLKKQVEIARKNKELKYRNWHMRV
jgi:c-di-GMP-binding flagellar brake protein YcgR